ncbi:MAG: phosphoenolpyruvate--protein phosphotransferase [Gammaproteobacteria bacterium]|nr:phosphoenolpyruvate--protein phosphotransferase [Gammaproteobacteria bacterium]NIR85300.1 phosphoenolpyruvate--protein phosphotransferase [Gammaproteobacteria bacterium]NIR88416.1 phosphoenolpyruvate--protein phosphotransferase [Gammaproteobacteria bacterium]NIU06366.1 phosphoenolpyruvate--protein phosphotransferase [Gammaproteobacteria bacterium]NIV53265.1 phosphoenolpyruvate--protein phosphotransferase [Gammaproteobacteria bacterium]
MKRLHGKPISQGYAVGQAFVYDAEHLPIPEYDVGAEEIGVEQKRLGRALRRASDEIRALQERLDSEYGHSEAEIFAAHHAFLNDPEFVESIRTRVRDGVNAERAVADTVSEAAQTLAGAGDPYLRERELDMRDLGHRVQRHLLREQTAPLGRLPPGSIIVAHELLPSDVLELDRAHVAGLLTEVGGEASHAAILARALGIAAVTGMPGVTQAVDNGETVLVDGESGEVVVDPDAGVFEGFLQRKERFEREISVAATAENRESVTADGVRVFLYGNIGRPDDAMQVMSHHMDGVGLFRTEYLFLDRPDPPGLEAQKAAYARAAEIIGGQPLVIRTLDFGGDKRPAFIRTQFEANPSLGMRGLRFSLAMAPDLFRTQLRAVLEVAASYDVRILFPMVLGGVDLGRALDVLRETARAAGAARLPPAGALIETPSAVFAVPEIVERADFLSIGTNDLTQFVLAADRNALTMMDDYTVLHPSVLRAIHTVVRAATDAGRPVSVCGEAAGDPAVACLLVGLGVRELSMSPVAAARVRFALQHVPSTALAEVASGALRCESPDAVRALLGELRECHPRADTG